MDRESLVYSLVLCSTGIASLICYIVGGYLSSKVFTKVEKVTAGLRLFGRIIGTIYVLMPLSSIFLSGYNILWDHLQLMEPKRRYQFRVTMAFGTQIFDLAIIVVLADRAVASLRQSHKPLIRTVFHGVFASFICAVVGGVISYVYFISDIYLPVPFSGVVTSMHVVCFLIELLLLNVNLCRHKTIPLTYNLSDRLNLARNISLLRLFCPYLFLITIMTSFGPVIFLFAKHSNFFYMSQIACVSILYSILELYFAFSLFPFTYFVIDAVHFTVPWMFLYTQTDVKTACKKVIRRIFNMQNQVSVIHNLNQITVL
uniref:Serpentine receptor class gamma n=1 Tax=Panagrellus redivivus TaxID=6233 RepID=A0A7E4VB56_PANRE